MTDIHLLYTHTHTLRNDIRIILRCLCVFDASNRIICKFDRSELYVNFNPTTSLYTLSQSMLMKFHVIKVYEETLQGHTMLTHLVGISGLRAVNVHLILSMHAHPVGRPVSLDRNDSNK